MALHDLQKKHHALQRKHVNLTLKLKYGVNGDIEVLARESSDSYIEQTADRLANAYLQLRLCGEHPRFDELFDREVPCDGGRVTGPREAVKKRYNSLRRKWAPMMAEMRPTFKWVGADSWRGSDLPDN